jgi:hypothetical protein
VRDSISSAVPVSHKTTVIPTVGTAIHNMPGPPTAPAAKAVAMAKEIRVPPVTT